MNLTKRDRSGKRDGEKSGVAAKKKSLWGAGGMERKILKRSVGGIHGNKREN